MYEIVADFFFARFFSFYTRIHDSMYTIWSAYSIVNIKLQLLLLYTIYYHYC